MSMTVVGGRKPAEQETPGAGTPETGSTPETASTGVSASAAGAPEDEREEGRTEAPRSGGGWKLAALVLLVLLLASLGWNAYQVEGRARLEEELLGTEAALSEAQARLAVSHFNLGLVHDRVLDLRENLAELEALTAPGEGDDLVLGAADAASTAASESTASPAVRVWSQVARGLRRLFGALF